MSVARGTRRRGRGSPGRSVRRQWRALGLLVLPCSAVLPATAVVPSRSAACCSVLPPQPRNGRRALVSSASPHRPGIRCPTLTGDRPLPCCWLLQEEQGRPPVSAPRQTRPALLICLR